MDDARRRVYSSVLVVFNLPCSSVLCLLRRSGPDRCVGDGHGKGCGLLLCESCAMTLVNEHDGVLEGLMNQLKRDEADGSFGLRADTDFLHPKGELLRRMAAG
ncbi:hypothetical protein N7G274_010058 [Stereocaulon virgatum]|uniref:Uncharacterized protein n=1 Tax=Stereocaulon virgatum TaxID=373712 RepID=A0ABR3ZVL7_9LECA